MKAGTTSDMWALCISWMIHLCTKLGWLKPAPIFDSWLTSTGLSFTFLCVFLCRFIAYCFNRSPSSLGKVRPLASNHKSTMWHLKPDGSSVKPWAFYILSWMSLFVTPFNGEATAVKILAKLILEKWSLGTGDSYLIWSLNQISFSPEIAVASHWSQCVIVAKCNTL